MNGKRMTEVGERFALPPFDSAHGPEPVEGRAGEARPYRRRLTWPPLVAAALPLLIAPALAQAPQGPYAAIDRNAVNYAGPGRDLAHDLGGPEIKIGLLAPLSGPRRAEGELLLRAAELALEDEAAVPLPHGCRIGLAKRDESGPWGQAASEVVRLVEEDRAIALITSSDGVAAHLAEQVSTKLGVPVITLSTDTTTTQINLPWIFRLGPADLDQARAFARNIYLQRCLKRVVVVTQLDHDGRVGAEAFKMVAKELSPETAPATVLVRVAANDTPLDANSVVQEILTQKPQALVFWTSSQAASELLGQMRLPSIPIYLCQKAAAGPSGARPRPDHEETGGIWTVSTEVGASVPPLRDRPTSVRAHFEQRYRERTGNVPSVAAAQAYDAVRIIAAALRNAGPNRARLRDALAETRNFPGASGPITFDHAGNDLSTVTLVPRD